MNQNPYASPTAALSPAHDKIVEVKLAWVPTRFLAAMIDNIITYVLFFGVFASAFSATTQPGRTMIMALVAAVFLLINVWLLVTRGQTYGKLILGIQVVDYHDNRLLSFFRIFLLRHNFLLPLILIALYYPGISHYFLWLASVLAVIPILFAEKRCLHDYVAGSKVVLFDSARSHNSGGAHTEQHVVFEDLQSAPQVNWQLARLEKRVSMLLALAGEEGDREAALRKLTTTGLTPKNYFEKTVVEIKKFADDVDNEKSKASASELLTRVKTVEDRL